MSIYTQQQQPAASSTHSGLAENNNGHKLRRDVMDVSPPRESDEPPEKKEINNFKKAPSGTSVTPEASLKLTES